MVLRAAAMAQPAHQRLVLADHLHPIDAEIEIVFPRVSRSLGHNERPCDQGRGFAGPAGLDRKQSEIDIGAFQDDLLTWRASYLSRLHREDRARQREQL